MKGKKHSGMGKSIPVGKPTNYENMSHNGKGSSPGKKGGYMKGKGGKSGY